MEQQTVVRYRQVPFIPVILVVLFVKHFFICSRRDCTVHLPALSLVVNGQKVFRFVWYLRSAEERE